MSVPRGALLVLLAVLLAALPLQAQDEPLIVRGLRFKGNHALDATQLSAAIATTNSSWFARTWAVKWIGLGEKRTFDPVEFQRDVLRLTLLYKKSGYMSAEVDTLVHRSANSISITFLITEGPPVRLDSLQVLGLDSVARRAAVERDLPLQVGDPFSRIQLDATSDTLVRRLRNLGYPDAVAFQSFERERTSLKATAAIDVQTGSLSDVSDIGISGTKRVSPDVVRSLLATRPGQQFSQEDLYRSQRNLYRSELFSFAAVTIDSARYDPASDSVPLTVRVIESKPRRARGSVGYATEDCIRLGAGITFRDFAGGGRVLDISGRLSKIGVGEPTAWGLEDGTMCSQLKPDTLGSGEVNYSLAVSLRRPAFLSPHNTLTTTVFADRRSDYLVYLRQEIGTGFSISRETAKQARLALTYAYTYGHTQASPASFCVSLLVCSSEDIARLSADLGLGTLNASASFPKVNNPLDPTRGTRTTLQTTISAQILGSASTQQFIQLVAERSWYRTLSRQTVLSYRLRGGVIWAPLTSFGSNEATNYIPPANRFYAGGPNDVRGYQLNGLGPINYLVDNDTFPVDTTGNGPVPPGAIMYSPIGGNMLGVGNVELRLPSPIWGRVFRWVVFVDAGVLWDRYQTDPIVRVTPGAGIRLVTPLGPVRLDVGYNGYGRQSGALYQSQDDAVYRIREVYTPSGNPDRFVVHFAVGQAF
ncbi:MAG TPA: BamA/TamA family outer membrane protein [Gemmatimonadales bacterium]|nr:BamA/TamA family outer membrane protein [Gemmatimonadales bacterium]